MFRQMLIGKIHRARVTDANVNYIGSITLDADLMKAAGILPWEWVQVVDINNGSRLETYVIQGEAGSGDVKLNGAAARLVMPGDLVIIMNYGFLSPEELVDHHPKVVFVDENNRITSMGEMNAAFEAQS